MGKKDKSGGGQQPKAGAAAAAAVPEPEFIKERLAIWDKVAAEYKDEISKKPQEPIVITLPDGSKKDGVSFQTSPMDIASGISQGLAQSVISAKVNGQLWDLARPLEESCSLELIKFDSAEGKHVFWHSSAHILGQALEKKYGAHLCIGPPLDDQGGFYYDSALADGNVVHQADFDHLKTLINGIVKEKQKFERLEIRKEDALEMFKYNKYKVEIIKNKVPDGEKCTAYRCGPLIDLCKGPHVPHTGKVKAMEVTKLSSAYWLGKAENDSLQRVYGMSFPDKKELKEWKQFQEEAQKRDHRVIGKQQELFFFHQLSPGSPFFLPHGARIYSKLQQLIQTEYRQRGFEEVRSPTVFNHELWKISGHLENYIENIFSFKTNEDENFALKPMNCPGHCLIFSHRKRSYRELPLRLADFGVLHRNELSGALSGLTRVRRFHQDDAHIFCRQDQVEQELDSCIGFLERVYGIFGYEFDLELSTRPEKFLGDVDVWDRAEQSLQTVLDRYAAKSGKQWRLNAGDGAFYGPKIDIHIRDAMRRSHQCATIQLDFQLPLRFDLEFAAGDDSSAAAAADGGSGQSTVHRPVIIHRAIFGSIERFMAILIEHTAGKWPFWLSPRQLCICPVSALFHEYAHKVRDQLAAADFYVDIDLQDSTLPKKIRNAQLAQYNYILVVGAEEQSKNTVNVRTRDNEVHGERSVQALIEELNEMVKNFK